MKHHPRNAFLRSVAAALACAAGGSASAQFPAPADPARPFPPLSIPRMRDRPAVPAAGPERRSMAVVGKDASVGIVSPDSVPPDPREFSALVADGAMVRSAPALLVLADGQRIPGSIEERDGAASWRSAWLAPIPMDLEGVRGIAFGEGEPPPAKDADVILLRNGDRRSGIVTSIGAKVLSFEEDLGQGLSEVRVPVESVVAVGLAGPTKERSGIRVWLGDGAVIDAPRAAWLGPEYLQLPGVPGARTESVTIPRAALRAVQVDPAAVAPLASLAPAAALPPGFAGISHAVAPPAAREGAFALDAPPLEVEGPVVLSYPASSSPRRLIATLRRPEAARVAGDVDLVIRSGGRDLHHERLDAGRPVSELRVDLPAGPFELLLLPAGKCAAGCHVILERALLCRR